MSGATTVESNDLMKAAVERALTEPDGAYSSSSAASPSAEESIPFAHGFPVSFPCPSHATPSMVPGAANALTSINKVERGK